MADTPGKQIFTDHVYYVSKNCHIHAQIRKKSLLAPGYLVYMLLKLFLWKSLLQLFHSQIIILQPNIEGISMKHIFLL